MVSGSATPESNDPAAFNSSEPQSPPQKASYNEVAFGKLGVDAVVFTVNTIQIAKAKIRYYWPSDETKKAVQSFVERRPVLSSFLGLQLASLFFPTLSLLVYASCSAIAVAIGAILSLVTALGFGLCVFVPTIVSIMFITFLVWLGGYCTYCGALVAYTVYMGCFRGATEAEEVDERNAQSGKEVNERRPMGLQKTTPASDLAGCQTIKSEDEHDPTKHVASNQLPTIVARDGNSHTQSSRESTVDHEKFGEINDEFHLTRDAMIELERSAPPKPSSREGPTREEKITSDIARSLQ